MVTIFSLPLPTFDMEATWRREVRRYTEGTVHRATCRVMDNIRARETPSKPKMLTTMDAVRAGMRGGLRAAGAYDAVHKDECAFSFHTPYSTPAGLLLNLHTLRAVSDEFLAADHARSGGVLYLRMQYTKVRVPRPPRTKP